MTTFSVRVPNISCAHCVHTIQTEVGALPGVRTVEADEQSKLVTIAFEPPATREGIEALLAEIDYPAGAFSHLPTPQVQVNAPTP